MSEYVVRAMNLPADEMVRAYLECAEWAGVDDEQLEAFGAVDKVVWTAEALWVAQADCLRFLAAIATFPLPAVRVYGMDRYGHDLWLSRNGHGAGFFGRDELGEIGKHLQRVARRMGGAYVYFDEETGELSLY